ncbi:hypothetical protein I350_04431, partial [Cryptococcus amylolentus CBS 6273]
MAPSRTQRSQPSTSTYQSQHPHTQAQHGNLSEEFGHSTQSQRRAKITNAKDIFRQPDQEEQLRLGREYRSLQTAAD